MGNNKKFLWHATCALLALSAVPAWAEDGEDSDELVSSIDESQPAVLFKVHDIKPLKNRDGKITNCEFNITFFNRSNKNVDNATVNLTWKDEAIGNVIEDEKELAKRKMEMENYNENGGAFAPGFGMIGTLMGLIAMMANMKDPTQIGGGMALAMITTFYGLLLGTLLYGPFSEKILLEAEKTLEIDLMVLEGVVNLKAKKSSIHMKDIVKTFGKKAGGPEQPSPKAR